MTDISELLILKCWLEHLCITIVTSLTSRGYEPIRKSNKKPSYCWEVSINIHHIYGSSRSYLFTVSNGSLFLMPFCFDALTSVRSLRGVVFGR